MVGWVSTLTASHVLSLIGGLLFLSVVIGQGWLLLNLLRQNGRLLLRLEALEERLGAAPIGNSAPQPVTGLPVGIPAPGFELASLDGTPRTLDDLLTASKPVLLVFSDPGCGPCTALLPDLAHWQQEHAATVTVALISRGTPEANRAKLAAHGLTHVLLQQEREVAQAYQVQGTPSAVLVQRDGTIGSPVAIGAEAIATLVARMVDSPAPAPRTNGQGTLPAALPLGAPAPPLILPDLNGTSINLMTFRGQPTLLVFWNPGCGFCQHMLDDLKAWEAHPPKGAPRLLVISTGSVDANQALGLQSPIVLDQQFATARQFGASGTPSAVLLDAEGHLASQVVVGAQAVLALANDPRQIRLTTV